MKNIFKIVLLALLVILFSSCGGGGGDSTSANTRQVKICEQTNDINSYTNLRKGDKIVKDDDNTIVSFYHVSDGTKKVCVKTGKAKVISQN